MSITARAILAGTALLGSLSLASAQAIVVTPSPDRPAAVTVAPAPGDPAATGTVTVPATPGAPAASNSPAPAPNPAVAPHTTGAAPQHEDNATQNRGSASSGR